MAKLGPVNNSTPYIYRSKFGHWGVMFWSKFVVNQRIFKLRAKISGVTIWSKFAVLKRTQLGPDNNPYLDQIVTPQHVFFNNFSFQNGKSSKMGKNGQNDNFSHLAKRALCCNPPLDQTIGVFNLHLNKGNIDVEQITKLKIRKTNKGKGDLKEKIREEPNKKRIDETKLCNWIFCCCSFRETKAKKNIKKERDKNKEPKEKKEQEWRKKIKRERQKKRKWKRGRPKKAKKKQRETLQNKQKCPF